MCKDNVFNLIMADTTIDLDYLRYECLVNQWFSTTGSWPTFGSMVPTIKALKLVLYNSVCRLIGSLWAGNFWCKKQLILLSVIQFSSGKCIWDANFFNNSDLYPTIKRWEPLLKTNFLLSYNFSFLFKIW